MFLSVSIPVYNAENTVDKCIESVMKQTLSDFELILVDDGSTDDSLKICREWERRYPDQIRTIHNENAGSLLARRCCIKESRGDYLYVIDADDYITDNKAFQLFRNSIEHTHADLILFDYTSEDGIHCLNYDTGLNDYGEVERNLIYKELLTSDRLNPLWNKVFSRQLVDWDYDYSRYSYISNGTDAFQIIPILSAANKVIYLRRALYYYKTSNNGGSIVHKFNCNVYRSLRTIFLRLVSESVKWGMDENEVEILLADKYMKIASSSAFKLRLVSDRNFDNIKFLKSIGEDELFRIEYRKANLSSITWPRRLIVKLLYDGKNSFLNIMIKVFRTSQLNVGGIAMLTLSIIIPSYNTSKFMDVCLPSFIDNRLTGRAEVLIINDGSTDNTSIKAHEYQNRYPQLVRVIDKMNGGHGSVINRGAIEARGRYIKVVDGDDWVHTENLVKSVDYLERTDSDMVLNPYITVDISKNYKQSIQNLKIQPGKYNIDDIIIGGGEYISPYAYDQGRYTEENKTY